ncbi:MAG: antitoxin [Candidatus Bathyarchaeota archaeon B24]|nr:MAG: antitoxin [Candidatus Bathyarchaeota archaeon B24]RLI25636.1 MAG: antitoxin [Candidatus Bathyarchaeota archaeon]
MKTLSIRDDVYEKLRRLKREGESFSDVIDRLIAREKTSLRFFFGKLKGSELLESMEQEVLSFRRRATLREI